MLLVYSVLESLAIQAGRSTVEGLVPAAQPSKVELLLLYRIAENGMRGVQDDREGEFAMAEHTGKLLHIVWLTRANSHYCYSFVGNFHQRVRIAHMKRCGMLCI